MRDPVSNSRLTAVTALCLLMLLSVEGATLLSLQTFLTWHILVGIALLPVVGLKLTTTGYRFFRFYTGDPEYVAVGPPALPLRVLGPVVVSSTLGLFTTGVVLGLVGPGMGIVLSLHKASFVVWVAATSTHVLAHSMRVKSLAGMEIRTTTRGAGMRIGAVAAAVVTGAVLAVAAIPLVGPWTHWMHHR